MADITFDSDNSFDPQRRVKKASSSFSLIPFILRTGIVSTEQNAKRLLIVVALAGFLIAFMIPHFIGGGPSGPTADPIKVQEAMSHPIPEPTQ